MSGALGTAATLGVSPPVAAPQQTLAQLGGPATQPVAKVEMPVLGPMPGELFLNPKLAPNVPENAPRPFAPGEFIRNPDGGWSSEITMTVTDPRLNEGKATVVPSLWIVNGQAITVPEDKAVEFAVQSGLPFQSFESLDEAEKFSIDRESAWQGIDSADPTLARSIAPLWSVSQ